MLKDTEAIYEGVAVIRAKDYNSLYGDSLERDFNVPVILTVDEKEKKSNITLKITNSTPDLWTEMARASGNEGELLADVNFILTDNPYKLNASIIMAPVSFTMMKNVTNEAIRKFVQIRNS